MRRGLCLFLLGVHVDVQAQALGVQVQLVLAAALLQDLGNVARVLDLPKLDVTLALLDRVSNQLGGAGLTLGTDNESLLLLAGLVDQESRPLGFLLSNLLGFDGGREFGGEGQML